MTVVDLQTHREAEEEGKTTRELIAVRYIGNNSSFAPSGSFRQQSYAPSTALMNQGIWKIWLVPDQGLRYLEQKEDIEIHYTPEKIAEALLQKTNLPDNIFSRAADAHLQTRLFNKLGLNNVGLGEDAYTDYVDQLADIAGIDLEEEESEFDIKHKRAVQSYLSQSRKVLIELAEDTHPDPESAGKIELAEHLADNNLQSDVEQEEESVF